MKDIKPDELFANVGAFLKERGIELTDGTYSQRLRRGCELLTDAINLAQAGIARAKSEIDEKLDRMRRVIHEKTAPRQSTPAASKPAAAAQPPVTAKRRPAGKPSRTAKSTGRKARR